MTRIISLPILFLPAILGAQNVITTIAGNGLSGFSGDGAAAVNAELSVPSSVAVDSSGNVYIADSRNNRVRKVSSSGIITTFAGNGTAGYSGDGLAAANAELNSPTGVAVDAAGHVYIADSNNNCVRVVVAGLIYTAAGNGTAGFLGDGGPVGGAELYSPYGVAVDASGNLYIADTYNSRIRMVTPPPGGIVADGTITTIAGNGVAGYSGDGAAATSAQLYHPNGVAVDASGNIYIADTFNSRIRMVAGGNISTLAGTGAYGHSGDGGAAINATMSYPFGIAVDASGNVYIADASNEEIRVVSNGVISTYAGSGVAAYSGDGGSSMNAGLENPTGVALDAAGHLYIADNADSRVRLVAPAAPPAGPSIQSAVSASGFGDFPVIAPGSWIEIYGANLADDSRAWNASDFAGLNAPTSLDGTSVTIGGEAAFVGYISPGQVNVQAPMNLPAGPLPIVVQTGAGSSAAYTVTVNATAPGLLAPASFDMSGAQYAVAMDAGAFVLPGSAAHPGDSITLYGIGFGPVTGSAAAGEIAQTVNSLTLPMTISIGGAAAQITYAGSAPASVGLYQFNVTVPQVAAGKAIPLTFTLGSVAGKQTLYIAVE